MLRMLLASGYRPHVLLVSWMLGSSARGHISRTDFKPSWTKWLCYIAEGGAPPSHLSQSIQKNITQHIYLYSKASWVHCWKLRCKSKQVRSCWVAPLLQLCHRTCSTFRRQPALRCVVTTATISLQLQSELPAVSRFSLVSVLITFGQIMFIFLSH